MHFKPSNPKCNVPWCQEDADFYGEFVKRTLGHTDWQTIFVCKEHLADQVKGLLDQGYKCELLTTMDKYREIL